MDDLTFDLFHKSYFKNYNKFHQKSLKSGHYLEKLSLNKALKIIYSIKYAQENAINKYKLKTKTEIIPFGSDISLFLEKNFLFY